ncbi:GDSL-like Lipase/Acylhydrolase-like protein [Lineolata rhizophorae]|uniref:GDSL-like Lipase/Acylhydrolase-like protein n=1 Tax=Lineolata rhizophorae TaxID=578093 RepID=A0A6A6P4M6_9PEZI|nr:GDSL-like Lipase/Acylhydrolase-like protein [Lineolata rhizophorae]
MRLFNNLATVALSSFVTLASATILQNGQVRDVLFPDTQIATVTGNDSAWTSYPPSASGISYKGSAPGLKFGFTGDKVALSFGEHTSPGVLVGYRLDGQDWEFTNVTAGATHQFVSASTPGFDMADDAGAPDTLRTFELYVSNWAFGVQVVGVHVAAGGQLVGLPNFARKVEVIGDSIASGMYDTYESMAGWAWDLGAGLGNVEFGVTAYPGICLVDQDCWGNPRGQAFQWFRASDTSPRARQMYGELSEQAEMWDFESKQPADLVIVHLGTNDNNTANNVPPGLYYDTYVEFVGKVHEVWPQAQIILVGLWNGFSRVGSTWREVGAFVEDIYRVYEYYSEEGYVHYFNTTGILQHNDIAPQYHPTDVGQIKVASHLMQYVKNTFGWDFGATGPEVQHETLYWNDQEAY